METIIKMKAVKMTQEQLDAVREKRKQFRPYTFWPEYGDGFIKENFPEMNDEQIAWCLGVSYSAAKQRRLKLGLMMNKHKRHRYAKSMALKAKIYEGYVMSSVTQETAVMTAKRCGVSYSYFARVVKEIAPRPQDRKDFIVRESKINYPDLQG